MDVLLVDAQMPGELLDTFCEDCYLEFRGAGVVGVEAVDLRLVSASSILSLFSFSFSF